MREVKNLSSTDDLAHFLQMKPSTLRSRKSRDSIPYQQIISNLDIEEIGYVFKGSYRNNSDIDKAGEPSNQYDESSLADYEQTIDDLIDKIEHGPFSHRLKIRLIDALIRIYGEELDEFNKQ